MFLVFAFLTSSTLAQDETGKWVLQMKTKKLTAMRDSITLFIKKAAEDGIINNDEIDKIQSLIKNFKEEKQIANKWLKKYGLAVGFDINPLIISAVNEYIDHVVTNRDPDGTVQMNLMEAAKLDEEIEIEPHLNLYALWIIIAFIVADLLFIVSSVKNNKWLDLTLGLILLVLFIIAIFI